MPSSQQESSHVQAEKRGRNTKGKVTFRGESTVSDLGSLESNNHVGSRTQHGQVTSDSSRVRHKHPFVGSGKGESGGKHLAHGNVGGDIGQNGHNHDKPVDTGSFGHLLCTSTHGEVEERLGNTSIVKRSNKEELSNEKHQKTIVDFSEGSFRFRNEFFLFWLDFVSVHVVSFLGRERISIFVILNSFRSGIKVLSLVRSNDHENASSHNGDNAHIESGGKESKEAQHNQELNLGPDGPSVDFFLFPFLGGCLTSVVSMFLSEHLRSAVSSEHDTKVFHESRGSREQFGAVVHEHHNSVHNGSSSDGKNHVHKELSPRDIVVSQGDNKDILRVTSHGKGGTNVGSSGKGKEVREGVGDLVANAEIHDDTGENEGHGIVHDSGGSNGRHHHNLEGTLPVDRVVKGFTKLVKKTSHFHLFNVNGSKHETKEQEQRLHNDHTLGIEVRSVVGDSENVTPDNHGKTSSQSKTGSTNGPEPVREHEENPESKVDQRGRPFSKGSKVTRFVNVSVFSEVTMTAASVFHDTTFRLRKISGSKSSTDIKVSAFHGFHLSNALLCEVQAALGTFAELRGTVVEHGSVDCNHKSDSNHGWSPFAEGRHLFRRFSGG